MSGSRVSAMLPHGSTVAHPTNLHNLVRLQVEDTQLPARLLHQFNLLNVELVEGDFLEVAQVTVVVLGTAPQ